MWVSTAPGQSAVTSQGPVRKDPSPIGEAVVMDLTFKGTANARIQPEDLERAERALNAQGISIESGGMLFLRTDWPRGHVTTDPKWDEPSCLTKASAEWLVAKQPKVFGYDFAQEEKGSDYEKAEENLINLDQVPSKVKVIALPVKWTTESAPARAIALLDD